MSARKPRCRVGDHCFVIWSTFPANVGRVVTIVRRSWPQDRPETELWWLARSEGTALAAVNADGQDVRALEASARDLWLLPIRPGADPDAVDTTKPTRRRQSRSAPAEANAVGGHEPRVEVHHAQ